MMQLQSQQSSEAPKSVSSHSVAEWPVSSAQRTASLDGVPEAMAKAGTDIRLPAPVEQEVSATSDSAHSSGVHLPQATSAAAAAAVVPELASPVLQGMYEQS